MQLSFQARPELLIHGRGEVQRDDIRAADIGIEKIALHDAGMIAQSGLLNIVGGGVRHQARW